MSSAETRLTIIDQSSLSHHSFLRENDECYYLMEYIPRQNYTVGECNSLISNLKKSPLKKAKQEYYYKIDAIARCAKMLAAALSPDFKKIATFVPVPCSKAKDDPEYDNRIETICRCISPTADVRNLVIQTESRTASHTSSDGQRQSKDDLISIYQLTKELCTTPNVPSIIAIVDDVLTTGRHFRAMEAVLRTQFPNTRIVGIFIARRVPAASVITNPPYLKNTI